MTIEISYPGGAATAHTVDAALQLLDRLRAGGDPIVLVVRVPDDSRLLEVGLHGDRGFVHRTSIQGDAACWSCQSTFESGGYYLADGVPAFAEVPYAGVRQAVQELLTSPHAPA